MFKSIVVALLLLLCAGCVFAQSFLVVTNTGIKRVKTNGSVVTEQSLNTCSGFPVGNSIALRANNIYSFGWVAGQGTVVGNDIVNCVSHGVLMAGNSLTIDKNNLLYTVQGNELYTIDPVTLTKTLLGNLPYSSAGDLVFYKNELYLASPPGIVKINLSNLAQSTLVIPTPNLTNLYGLAEVAYSSTQNKVYALNVTGSGSTDIYELDLDHNTLGSKLATLPDAVYDAASDVEDGLPPALNISQIKQYADCPFNGKGTIEVLCTNALVDYQYTLDGVTNNTGVFSGLDPGTYHITVTSSSETASTTFTVSTFTQQKPALNITKVNPLCVDPGQIKVAAVSGGADFRIKYGNDIYNFDHTFNNLTTGNYHFDILNASGCVVDSANVSLTQDVCKINVTATSIAEECNDPGKGSVKISTSPHNETYTYSIDNISNTTGVFNGLAPGDYQVNIVASNGETKTVPIQMPDYDSAKPVITVIKKDPVCDISGSISFTMPGSISTQYRIQLGSDIFSFDHVFTGLSTGNYHFAFIKQDNCLLGSSDISLQRTKCTIAVINTDISEECNLPGKGMVKVNTKPHPDAYSYILSDGTINGTGVFDNLPAGNYQIKIQSPEDEQVINLVVPDFNSSKPVITYNLTNQVCDKPGTIQLVMANTNTGIYKARLNNVVYEFDHLFTNLIAGNYHFDVLKQDGCILTELDVTVLKNKCEIALDGVDVQQECNLINKGVAQIKSRPHDWTVYNYALDNGDTNTTGVFNNLAPGNYNVTVTSDEDQKQIQLTVPDYRLNNPVVTFTAKDAICEIKGHVKFNMANSQNYKIQFSGNKFPLDYDFQLSEGAYQFTVIKPDGCLMDTYNVSLKKEACETLAFPNTFTPNGDGINDIFEPNQSATADDFKFKIYNRYGVLLFTSGSSHIGWDGTCDGKSAPVGVYYWIATYINNEGRSLKKNGYVTLVR